jgi:hypothetical protein
LRRLGLVALGLPLALLLAPLSLLLGTAETVAGRHAGGVALAMLVGLVALAVAALRGGEAGRPWAVAGAVSLAVALALFAAQWNARPRPASPGRGGFLALRTGGRDADLPSWSELLPERDAVLLGARLATRLVPWMSRREATTIRGVLSEAYRALDDPDAGRPASVLLPSLLGSARVEGHYFAVRPAARPGEHLGMVVFLHGNGGNFLALPWAWRPLAERLRVVAVFPTDGFGFWNDDPSRVVAAVRQDALARFPEVDPSRVWLGGISDGGVGVTRASTDRRGEYRGLIYVSPTLRPAEIDAPGFAASWRGRPILVLQGGRDWSVTPASVDRGVAALRAAGAEVTDVRFAEEGHFLFFARTAAIGDRLAAWMAAPASAGDGSR